MQSIYEPATIAELTSRIDKLTPSSQRQWGKMDVAQMLAHCSVVMEMALGGRTEKSTFMGRVIGRFVKPMVTNEKPFKQNMPTGPGFLVADKREFNKEKTKLIGLLGRMLSGGAGAMHNRKHSFFGPLTSQEWSNSTVKHLDHHLRQFGV